MTTTLYIRNLRSLRRVEWPLSPLNVLVGPNGTGKTTLILVLRALRTAWDRDLPLALDLALGGTQGLRSWQAPEDEPIELGLANGSFAWTVQLSGTPGRADWVARERLVDDDQEVVSRDSFGQLFLGERVPPTSVLAVRQARDAGVVHPALEWIAQALGSVTAFHDADLWELRSGSRTDQNRHLHARGTNATSMLRRWRNSREDMPRFEAVRHLLRLAFPQQVADLDFQEAGTTVVADFHTPGGESYGMNTAANGVLSLVVTGTAIMGAPPGAIVAIDEPEHGLHPFAVQVLMEWLGQIAERRDLAVILTTHSPVLLNTMREQPECVWMTLSSDAEGASVVRITDQFRAEWLSGMGLGDRLEHGTFGTNQDHRRSPVPWQAVSPGQMTGNY